MTDAIIIGGGVAGLTAAAALAPHRQVTLLETEAAFGYHASGRSAAQFLKGYGNETVRALNTASLPAHLAGDVLSPRPVLILGGPGDEVAFKTECTEMSASPITSRDATRLVPILNPAALAMAAYASDAFDIDTDQVMQQAARTARAHGATLKTTAPVTGIARDGAHWTVTADRTYHAGIVINAAGAWADRIAELAGLPHLGLVPYRRSMARLPAPGDHDLRSWPMLLAAGEAWYAKPDAGAWIVSPGEAEATHPHDAWADDMVIAEGLARYQEFVLPEVTRVLTTWAGLRTFAPDRTPVIGPDPRTTGFFWLAGQGGYGFQTAPAAAALLAARVTGSAPELDADHVARLDPARILGQTSSGR